MALNGLGGHWHPWVWQRQHGLEQGVNSTLSLASCVAIGVFARSHSPCTLQVVTHDRWVAVRAVQQESF